MGRRRVATGPALIAICVALGGLLRLAVLELNPPGRLLGDEIYYVDVATQIANGRGHYSSLYGMRAGWPPLHPFFLSLFIEPGSAELAPADRRRLLRVQVALGTLLVAGTGLLAWALFDARTGAAAAGFAALHPTFVAYSHYFWSETLFALLVTLALASAVWARERGGLARAAATGVLFGLATLTREAGLLLALACAGWRLASAAAGRRRRAAARAALMLLCALASVAPWTLRNHARLGHLVPVSTAGWMGAREGNTLPASGWLDVDWDAWIDFRRTYFAVPDEIGRMQLARRQALALVREEQPLWIVRKLVRSTVFLFQPGSFLFFKIHGRGYVDLPLARVRLALLASLAAYAAMLLLAAASAPGAPGAGRRSFPVWVLSLGLCVHVFANASTRYRMPIEPLLIAYAARALAHPRATWRALRGTRWLALAAAAALLAAGGAYFHADAVSLWQRGRLTGLTRS